MNLQNNPAFEIIESWGEEKKVAETARKMYQKGFSIADIAEMVNMPVSWVEDVGVFIK